MSNGFESNGAVLQYYCKKKNVATVCACQIHLYMFKITVHNKISSSKYFL